MFSIMGLQCHNDVTMHNECEEDNLSTTMFTISVKSIVILF